MDASKVYNKSYQISILIVIYFLLFFMFPHGNGNNLANGQQQETKANQIAKSKKISSSSSTSKISSGSLKFKNNIKVLKQKQQAQSNKTTEIKVNNNNNFISLKNQLTQSASLDGQISQQQQEQQQEQLTTSGGGNIQTNQQNVEEEREENFTSQEQQTNDKQQMILGLVDGMPGVDFPGLTTIPVTQFSCNNVPYEPGMYADESTGCQVYHLCFDGRRESFICSVGTIFNQANLACDFWHQVDCSKSSKYYNLNLEFGKASPEPVGRQASAVNRLQQKASILPNLAPNFINKQRSSFTSSSSSISRQQQQQLLPETQQTITADSRFAAASSFALDGPISQQSGSTLSNKANKRQQDTNPKRGFVSPGRHVKLINHLSQSSAQQVSPESSNQVKLLTKDAGNSANDSLAKGKIMMMTTLQVNSKEPKAAINANKTPKQSRKNNSKKNKVKTNSTKAPQRKEEKMEEMPMVATPSKIPAATKAETIAEANTDDIWRPYTKKRKQSKLNTSGTTRAPTFLITTTTEGPLSQTISSPSGASSTENSLDSNNYSQTQMEFNGETTTQNPSQLATQQLDTSSEQPILESGGSGFSSSTMQTSSGEPEMEVNLPMTTQMPPEMLNTSDGGSQMEPSFGGGETNNNNNEQSVPTETPDFPASTPAETLTTNSEQLEGGVISVREAGGGSPEEQPQVTKKPTTRASSSFVEYENTTSS